MDHLPLEYLKAMRELIEQQREDIEQKKALQRLRSKGQQSSGSSMAGRSGGPGGPWMPHGGEARVGQLDGGNERRKGGEAGLPLSSGERRPLEGTPVRPAQSELTNNPLYDVTGRATDSP